MRQKPRFGRASDPRRCRGRSWPAARRSRTMPPSRSASTERPRGGVSRQAPGETPPARSRPFVDAREDLPEECLTIDLPKERAVELEVVIPRMAGLDAFARDGSHELRSLEGRLKTAFRSESCVGRAGELPRVPGCVGRAEFHHTSPAYAGAPTTQNSGAAGRARRESAVQHVTGAGGFLGRPLVERLVADGLPVRAMHHREPAAPRRSRAAEVRAALEDFDSLRRAAAGCETIFHLAGKAHDLDARDADAFRSINVEGNAIV